MGFETYGLTEQIDYCGISLDSRIWDRCPAPHITESNSLTLKGSNGQQSRRLTHTAHGNHPCTVKSLCV
uniref:Uncharacterized protein n=1 Tax=Anguilla anguilla TaxID=7936 RepID=A0A0E9WCQ3_ANGAN